MFWSGTRASRSKCFFAKAETGENLFGLSLDLIAVQFVEAIIHVIVNFLRVQRFNRMIRLPRLADAVKCQHRTRSMADSPLPGQGLMD